MWIGIKCPEEKWELDLTYPYKELDMEKWR